MNDQPDTNNTTRWRPTTPLEKLSHMLAWPPFVKLEHGLATGCRCGSCEVYRLSWEDDDDKPVSVESDGLTQAIEAAWERVGDHHAQE